MKKLLIFILLILSAFCAYAQNIDPELLKRAETGDVEAQVELGLAYYGLGDIEKSFYWTEKAAEQGNAFAQNATGYLYYMGRGVTQNYETAIEWYSKAAKQGYAEAQTRMGLMYSLGRGVKQDYEVAFEWFEKAAKQGHVGGQENLGLMYITGQGVPQDNVTGCAWIYISQNIVDSAMCDSQLTPNQMTRALHLVNELKASLVQNQ